MLSWALIRGKAIRQARKTRYARWAKRPIQHTTVIVREGGRSSTPWRSMFCNDGFWNTGCPPAGMTVCGMRSHFTSIERHAAAERDGLPGHVGIVDQQHHGLGDLI